MTLRASFVLAAICVLTLPIVLDPEGLVCNQSITVSNAVNATITGNFDGSTDTTVIVPIRRWCMARK